MSVCLYVGGIVIVMKLKEISCEVKLTNQLAHLHSRFWKKQGCLYLNLIATSDNEIYASLVGLSRSFTYDINSYFQVQEQGYELPRTFSK